MSALAKPWLLYGVVTLASGGAMHGVASTFGSRSDALEPASVGRTEADICVPASDGAPGGFRADVAVAHARMHRAMEDASPTGNPDRDFVRSMIPHHQGAIDMALIQLKYGRDVRMRRLAQTIIVEQGQEIAYMRALLDAPGFDQVARRPGGAQ